MERNRRVLVGLIAAIGLLLAACNQPVADVPGGFVTLSVGLEGSLASADLEPAGAPFEPDDGDIAVDNVQVSVFDKNGALVEFDLTGGEYTAQPGGGTMAIELTPADPTAQVNLPAAGNPYTFESLGYDAPTGNVIAYDTQDRNVIDASTVMVTLTSVLDDPSGAVLVPRFPTNYAMPGSVLDLMLVVMANENADFPGDYLQVPLSDFEVSYESVTGGSIIGSSKRGIRIDVNAECSAVSVTGEVSGLVDTGSGYEVGTLAIQGDGTYEIDCPAPFAGDVSVDLEAPTVSMTYDSVINRVFGAADDNIAISSVEVFDGPILVATTDTSLVDANVAQIVFAPGTTNWHADLTVSPSGELTAIATDSSGNESSVNTPFAGFVYVDANYTGGDSDGSEERPFQTVTQGLNAVAEGGTVYVLPGTYTATQYDIDKALTLMGADQGTVILQTTHTGGYGLEIKAHGVTIKGLTLEGPAGGAGNYGIKAFRADGLAGLKVEDVTVTNYGRSEVDLNTVVGAVLTNVTADGNGTAGVGFALSGVEDIVLQGVHTTGNLWGSVGLYSTNTGSINGVSDVDVDASSTFDEERSVYIDNEFGHSIGGLRLEGFRYAVFNPDQRDVGCPADDGRGADFIDFARSLEDAIALAVGLCPDTSTSAYIRALDTDGSGAITYQNVFHAGPGMSIQAAVDNAAPGAVVNLTAGTFDAGFAVRGAHALTIVGAGDSTVIDAASSFASGVSHKYTEDMKVVVLVDESSEVVLDGFQVVADDLAWGSELDAIAFWNASSGVIRDLDVVGPGVQTGSQTGQGLAVDASAGFSSQLLVEDTNFSGWNKNAIDIVNGNRHGPGGSIGGAGGDITVNVSGGSFTGGGATDVIAQNGIVYWDLAGANVTGTIDGVTISSLEYTEPGAEAAGVLPYGNASIPVVKNSTFDGSVQVYISNSTPNVVDATENNLFDGVLGSSATGADLVAIQDKIIEDPGAVLIQ